MAVVSIVLQDNTVVSLEESDKDEFPFSIAFDGTVACRYNNFEHAWSDLGNAIRCHNVQEAVAFI